MKVLKKVLKRIKKIKFKLTIIIRNLRRVHPFEKIRAKKYLKNNKPYIIDNQNNKYIKINVIGKISKKQLKELNFNKIDEFKDSLNFCDIDNNIVKTNEDILYGHFNNQLVVFENNDGKLAYISFKPSKNFNKDFKLLKKLVVSATLLKSNYIFVYIKNKKNDVDWKCTKYINKKLGKLGANYIVYSNTVRKNKQHIIKTYRNDIATYIIKEAEDFDNKKNYSSIIHIGLNLSNIKEQYQYYFLVKKNKEVEYLIDNSGELITKYNTKFTNLKEKNKLILFEDIFKILNIDFPEKCYGMEKIEVKKICSKFSEVTYNDVLFLLEPYRYNNDKTTATDSQRIEQAKKAIEKGALFIFSYLNLNDKIPHILCENVRESHIELCSNLHKKNDVITIAITGSVGKTTTKDMIACVLSQKYNVLKSFKNGNLQIKMGLNMQKIQPINDIFIQEVGGGRPGGASRHSRMINPYMSIITNIGTAHLGNFESQEDLMNNKLGIVDGMKEDGIFFQNLDDEFLQKAKVTNRKVITYSIKKTDADYFASDIKFYDNESQFNINIKKTGKKVKAHLNVSGEHNVLNAVVCYAIGDNLGLDSKKIIKGLNEYRTDGIRQNLLKIADVRVLLDCYNASLTSVETSLNTLDKLPVKNGEKKIAVLGDLTGIGEKEEEIHKLIALEIEKYKFDYIILHGSSIKITSEYLKEQNINHVYFSLKQKKELNNFLKSIIKSNDLLLIKGSSKVELEYEVDLLFGTNFTCERLIEEGEFTSIPGNDYKYKVSNKFAILYKYNGHKKIVRIKNFVLGKKNRVIYDYCFINNFDITSVKLNKNNVCIGKFAFKNCQKLRKIYFSNVKFIDEGAFENCCSLEEVKLNNGLTHLSDKVFYNCSNLKQIFIPTSVKQIGNNTFSNCSKLTILCHKDSYALNYAKEKGINYKCV